MQGLVHKFLAIEEMFDRDPTLAERVSFVQVTAPTVYLACCTYSTAVNSGVHHICYTRIYTLLNTGCSVITVLQVAAALGGCHPALAHCRCICVACRHTLLAAVYCVDLIIYQSNSVHTRCSCFA
jgi:hypothetical protein